MRTKEELFNTSMGNLVWLQKNYNHLKKKYDSKWIVVHNEKVVESGDTFEDILPSTKKYAPSSIMVEYIQSKEVAMFF
jgi:arabinogalactan endo-1,4-beta-galactosidase